jgi:hypothetical protein
VITAPRLALFFAVFAGCTLDWTVRPDPAAPADAGVPDHTAGDDDDSVTAPDAGIDADASPSGPPADCAKLRSDAASKKVQAKACNFELNECKTTVKDECGCAVAVGASSFVTAYENAVTALAAHPECSVCNGCPTPATSTCLQSPSGIACSP